MIIYMKKLIYFCISVVISSIFIGNIANWEDLYDPYCLDIYKPVCWVIKDSNNEYIFKTLQNSCEASTQWYEELYDWECIELSSEVKERLDIIIKELKERVDWRISNLSYRVSYIEHMITRLENLSKMVPKYKGFTSYMIVNFRDIIKWYKADYEKEACKEKWWTRWVIFNNPDAIAICNPTTTDWWKTCNDSNECESFCEAPIKNEEGYVKIWDKSEWTCYSHKYAICMREVKGWLVQWEWCH